MSDKPDRDYSPPSVLAQIHSPGRRSRTRCRTV